MNRILTDDYIRSAVDTPSGRRTRLMPRHRSGAPDFFIDMKRSLKRAALGRFFGVVPKTTAGRLETFSRPGEAAKAQKIEDEKQARDIYQAMLDITGH